MSPRLTRVGRTFALVCFLIATPVQANIVKPAKKLGRAPRRPLRYLAEEGPNYPRYVLNTSLGMTVSHASALASTLQFGFNFSPESRFYFGPEANFSLFSPGSVLGALADAWYELPLQPRLSLIGGVGVGPAFATQLGGLSATNVLVIGEATVSQELDDLVSIRGQLRPGLLGGRFVLQICFSLSFRFY